MTRSALALLFVAACTPKMDEDEARVRKAFDVPSTAKLVALHASPDKTGWQREGLRIVATFHVDTPAPAFAAPPWSPLPLPASVATFRRPPSELALPASGTYRCEVGVYTGGTSHTMSSCASPLPSHFDMYQTATFDPATGTLSAVMNYYY